MLVAYITADREALFSIFPDPGKFYAADLYTFFFTAFFTALLVLVFGPGKISMDSASAICVGRELRGYRTCAGGRLSLLPDPKID
jgi:hypothetical protein